MKHKWTILSTFVILYVIGIVGATWHTYTVTDAEKEPKTVASIKVVFIMLGGLGVILPTYLNVWQSLEAARLQQEGFRRQKVENTFRLIEKWDDKALLEARGFSRALKDREKQLSAEQLLAEIKEKPQLLQSVILIFNYFDQIRVSLENDRIEPALIKSSLGDAFDGIYKRFRPWVEDQSLAYRSDVEKLYQMMLNIK